MSLESVDATPVQNSQTFLKPERRYFLSSLAIILVSSTIFGLWFKIKQISIASPDIINFYPLTGYAIAVFQSVFFFSVLWLGLVLACRFVDRGKSVARHSLAGSLPFLAFMLSVFDIGLLVQFRLFLLLVVVLLFIKVYRNRSLLEEIKEPLTVLILIFLAYLFLYKSLSPFYYTAYYDAWGRIDFLVNYEHQWENAKAYDFLGNFTQRDKLGGFTQGLYGVSELLSLIILLLDIPLVDGLAKYGMIPQLYFYLYVFGSYGCYVFFRQGLKLSLLPSLIGGLGFVFGNAAFLSFWGAEYSIHQIPFVFFPWVCFLLKRSHDLNKPVLACAAGLIASLPEYASSSHPETNLGYLFFCNAYNVYLAFIRLAKERHKARSVKHFLAAVFIFPLFHLIGLAYKLIPLFEAIMAKEYIAYDVGGSYGLIWPGELKSYSSFVFRFETASEINPPEFFSPPITGTLVYFYTGQFAALMIFCFFIEACKKLLKKNANAEPNAFWEQAFYFPLMFLFLATVLPMGRESWFSKLISWVGFPRVHYLVRMNIYFYFMALATAMCGLEYLILKGRLRKFNILFGVYLLTLAGIYFSPLLLAMPDKPLLDGGILLAVYFSIRLFIKPPALFKSEKATTAYRSLLSLMIIAIAFYSFFTVNTRCNEFVTQRNNGKQPETMKDRLFISFRAATALLRGNPHDSASFNFLERRVKKFMDDIDEKTWQSAEFLKTREALEKIIASEQRMKSRSEAERNAYRLDLFSTIAPAVDTFYLNYGPSWVLIGASPVDWGPLAVDVYRGMQYYLPDKFQLFSSLGGGPGIEMISVGKNSDLVGALYSASFGYPAISVSFHLRSLYYDSLNKIGARNKGYDYNNRGLELEQITANKNAKKLLNIIGIDHLIFFDSYLKAQPSFELTLDALKSMGLVPVTLPESSRFTPRFSASYQVHVFANPQSYGKAYIAQWVKMMRAEENMLNRDFFHLPERWAQSKELLQGFELNLEKIPDDVEQSVIIESPDIGGYSKNPQVYKSNNSVEIVKLIGSKAVFNANCAEENCWLVYNTAVLKGWEAFSESERLPIHKANMGFIGVKLNKGKRFVWMEYRPFSLPLSFMIMLSGWLFVLFLRLFDPQITRKYAD